MIELIKCPQCTYQNKIPAGLADKKCSMCLQDLLQHSPVAKNYLQAYNEIPEFFIPRKMIHLQGTINRTPIKFIVDTGCQATCISLSLAKQCQLESLINPTFQGLASGVGTQKIIGKVCKVDILFEFGIIPTSLMVIDDQSQTNSEPLALLGLDVLFAHGCKINFKNRVLEINDQIKVPFME